MRVSLVDRNSRSVGRVGEGSGICREDISVTDTVIVFER